MRRIIVSLFVLTVAATSSLVAHSFFAKPVVMQDHASQRQKAAKLLSDNNHAEALAIYTQLATDPTNTAGALSDDFRSAMQGLNSLNRVAEFDQLMEDSIAAHPQNWRLLLTIAQVVQQHEVTNDGYIVGGTFERGYHRGGGKYVSSRTRDRVKALQLLVSAMPLMENDQTAKPSEKGNFYQSLAEISGENRHGESWRLQDLTDLETLPDYDEAGGGRGYGRGMFSIPSSGMQFGRGGIGRGFIGNTSKGAPVDEDGNPIFIQLPTSWQAAKTDGERWRWAMEQSAIADPSRRSEVDLQWAQFLQAEFGVRDEFVGSVPFVVQGDEDEIADQEKPAWIVHELADTETVANLATGPKKLTLPDEFNHIAVINKVILRNDGSKRQALNQLVSVRMNRHQYPQAAATLAEVLKIVTEDYERESVQAQIDQIVKNWMEFDGTRIQLPGKAATLGIRYRNGSLISFTAQPIDIEALLADTKAYLQSGPPQLDYQKLQIENVGYQLVNENQAKYLQPIVAEWNLELKPPANHFDAETNVITPLQKPGAYFVTAKMQNGNEARIVLWIADTAISRKRIEDGTLYYVADSVSGKPVANANMEFFGWNQERVGQTPKYRIVTSRFADRTDANGMCIPNPQELDRQKSWLSIARTADGRLAYDGFDRIWVPAKLNANDYISVRVYSMTDRPVYRPDHTVKFRMWVRQPRYHEDNALYAGEPYVLQIRNPKGDVVFEQNVTTDKWAGLDGEWTIPNGATLGQYALMVGSNVTVKRTRRNGNATETYETEQFRTLGQGSFKVEEYRKPEYEVTIDAPTKPVQLGEKIQATVNAKYFFGAPVTEATVHFKVERTKKDSRWYPVARWDWLYSPGYWWFGQDYTWYPGWNNWGCVGPIPVWRGWQPDPPEVVVEGDAKIGEDGTFLIDIDTAEALKEHSDSDHNYSITAEVVDQSRRTIIGSGSVLVAREPFKVFVWPNRGHYRTGDTVDVGMQARTPDGKGVKSSGKATLFAVSYEGEKLVEKAVQEWDVATDDQGHADLKIVVPAAGQFRVSVKLTDAENHQQEGGYVLFVRGLNEDGRGYRFNDIELITEKREYAPGEKISLQVNTNKEDSTVLLFVRPLNGLCPKPQVLQISGKSKTVELNVLREDMPNFFVEALTIADGRLHSDMKEIVVPPEKKIANVEVLPSSDKYRPGAEAIVKLKLTDIDGKPFVGNTVVSVYDASLEYIAASSIPEIRSFFWNMRRSHSIQNQTTLDQFSSPLHKSNETQMQTLSDGSPNLMLGFGGGGGMGGGGFGEPRSMMMRGDAMPMAAEAMMDAAPAEPGMAGAPMARMMKSEAAPGGGGAAPDVQPTMRSNFADTAYWVASVTSDASGIVEVKFKVPDNLTTWKIKAWTLGDGTRVGSGSSDIICSKDLLIRPQTPRFFTETDLVTLYGVVHNYLKTAKTATVVLETEGGQLHILGDAKQVVQIPAGGEVRVDWNVGVVASGTAKVRMMALTDEESDATELSIPVQVHGILKTESFAGVIRPDGSSATVNINVPAARIEEQSRLEVRYSPTLAGAMVDALPYLIEYPYGCTEQTLNRFLPSVITQKTLLRMGVNLADVQNKRTNLNAQEIGDPATRAAQWKRYDRNPVFDEAEMQLIIKTGVNDLTAMQLSDGGWGWFSGYGEYSSAHTTAQVVHGLTVAISNDVPVLPDVLARGVEWLKQHQQEELAKLREGDWRREHPTELKDRKAEYRMSASNTDAFVAFVLAEKDANDPAMTDYLYRDRGDLSVYAKALTGLVLHFQKDVPRRDMVLRNIEQFLEQDDENQTAWLRMPQNSWWYWYGSENEAMARYLQLLLKANPKSETAPKLVKYLLNNRKHGTYWNSTRDTALVVEAMADYIAATGEDKPNMTVEVYVDGTLQKKVQISAENLFSFDNVMLLQGDAVKTGAHKIELRRSGTGPVYFNAYLTNFTKEDQIAAAGLEVKVQRRFYKLERDDKDVSVQGDRGQVVKQQTARYKRIALDNLANVTSGDLIEVELIVDSKNDYEYLLLEDRKASGFELDDQRSGYVYEGLRAYRELRDDRVSFFLSTLARGQHSISYRIRAEMPSQRVSALPTKIEGMYAPELVGNSDEFKLRVSDR